MVDQVLLLAAALLLAAFAATGIRLDASAARLGRLHVNGRARSDSRVVVVRRWVNGRAGLLNHAGLGPEDGLLLVGARSVHTRGMLFPIDVVFLDRRGRVLATHSGVEPGRRRLRGPAGSTATLELAAGGVARMGLAGGDAVGVS